MNFFLFFSIETNYCSCIIAPLFRKLQQHGRKFLFELCQKLFWCCCFSVILAAKKPATKHKQPGTSSRSSFRTRKQPVTPASVERDVYLEAEDPFKESSSLESPPPESPAFELEMRMGAEEKYPEEPEQAFQGM